MGNLDLHINYRSITELIPYLNNARTHSDAQVAQIAASMIEFGWTNPVLVDGSNGIIAGHGRVMAARKLGLEQVPVIELLHLTPLQKKAYILADNKLALNAGWDEALLQIELADLRDANFDLDLIGFDAEELETLFDDLDDEGEGAGDEESVPELEPEVISRPGDIWVCGRHRVLCGDATAATSYTALLAGERAQMVFTDPPYNVNYANSAKDKLRGTDRAILNDNLGEGFEGFLRAAFENLLAHTDGGVYIAMSSSELDTLQSAFRAAGGKWSTFIIWAKNTFTLGRADYQRQFEPILYGWREGADRYWCGARDQGDVWFVNKPHKNDLHPTMKPIELVERAILNSSQKGEVVLDGFGGSGSTMIASEKSGRCARLIELDPKYVDVIVRRWQEYAGEEAIRETDGLRFAEAELALDPDLSRNLETTKTGAI